MQGASASLLSLRLALPLMTASPPATATENDDVLKIVDEFCADPRDNLKEVGTGASKLGYGNGCAQRRGPPPVHAVELVYGFEENKLSGAFTLTTNR